MSRSLHLSGGQLSARLAALSRPPHRRAVAPMQAPQASSAVPSIGSTAGSAAPPLAAAAAEAAAAAPLPRTCRRCKQQFDPATNGPNSCRYHSALWTGGEISKALGFCRQSDQPEHQLRVVHGRTGLIRFWDCCGAEDEAAPGCCAGQHVTYDDPDD